MLLDTVISYVVSQKNMAHINFYNSKELELIFIFLGQHNLKVLAFKVMH